MYATQYGIFRLTIGRQHDIPGKSLDFEGVASVTAYCPHCKRSVMVLFLLDDDGVRHALDTGAGIDVMHIELHEDGSSEDHRWELNEQETKRLKQQLVENE